MRLAMGTVRTHRGCTNADVYQQVPRKKCLRSRTRGCTRLSGWPSDTAGRIANTCVPNPSHMLRGNDAPAKILVSRFRSSPHLAARPGANFGIERTLEPISKSPEEDEEASEL